MIFSKLAWLFILSRILFMCQPWTIALTGVSIIAISWLFLHSVIITSLISSLICAWWYIFLYSYPKAHVLLLHGISFLHLRKLCGVWSIGEVLLCLQILHKIGKILYLKGNFTQDRQMLTSTAKIKK